MTGFISGLDLCGFYYKDIVEPLIKKEFPKLKYAAALIGPGSEVLGYDTEISVDHDWYPRVLIFLAEHDYNIIGKSLADQLVAQRPESYRGYNTIPENPDDIRFQTVTSVHTFWRSYLNHNYEKLPSAVEWLTFPEHRLLGLTSGRIYYSNFDDLCVARGRYSYYPDDIWYYMLASQWEKISLDCIYASRCGHTGNEIGSRLLAAKILKEIMQLGFFLERKYAPYSKWFARSFTELECADAITGDIMSILNCEDWQEREGHILKILSDFIMLANKKGILGGLNPRISNYHARPYKTLNFENVIREIKLKINSPEVKALNGEFGAVGQFIDSEKILHDPVYTEKLKSLYQ